MRERDSNRVAAIRNMKQEAAARADAIPNAERRYRDLFEEAPLMYVITRNSGGVPIIADCNKSFASKLGYSQSDLLDQPLADYYTPQSRKALLEGGYQRALDGHFVDAEREMVTRSGEILTTILRALPEYDAQGQVIGTRAMFVDISERKRFEEEIRRSEERFRRLFEESRDAIFLTTLESEIVDVNSAGVRLTESPSRASLLGKTMTGHVYKDPGEYEQIASFLAEQGYITDHEVALQTFRGNVLTALVTANAIRDKHDAVVGFQQIIRDVTEQKALEAQFRQAQKMEAVGRLAGGVAHDFNNLLTVISGYSLLVLSQMGSDEPHRQALEEIERAAALAASHTNRLLRFARMCRHEVKPLDLNATVADMKELLLVTLGSDIKLRTELQPIPLVIQGDEGEIQHAILNLAVNARDAMPDGGTLSITTREVRLDERSARRINDLPAGRYAELLVADTGAGIEPDIISRIFDPFYTTKPVDKGTGLGLSTVYAIVDQARGGITVESWPGQGTAMTLYFPAFGGKKAAAESPESPLATQTGSETILVVEDDDAVRAFVVRVLKDQGYDVLESNLPTRAIEIAEKHSDPVALLLTDVVMPGMSGVAVASHVVRAHPETRVLYMSGYPGEALKDALGTPSSLPLLSKPIAPRELLRAVRAALDQHAD